MLLAALLFASCHSVGLDLTIKAASLESVLAQVAAVSGEKLKAAPSLKQEIVLVRAKDVEPEELRARIAEAVDATWTHDANGWLLERKPQQERAIWDGHLRLRKRYLEEALAEIRVDLQKPFDAKSLAQGLKGVEDRNGPVVDRNAAIAAQRREDELFGRGPAMRLLKRLLLACNPTDLAAAEPYSRRVFRAAPTRLQFQIDATAYKAAMTAFTKEQAEWVEVAQTTEFPPSQSGRNVTDPRAQVKMLSDFKNLGIELYRSEMAGFGMVNLADRNPQAIQQIVCQLNLPDPSRRFLNNRFASQPAAEDPPVNLSTNSLAIEQVVKSMMMGVGKEPEGDRWREILADPVANDPLGLQASDGILSYTELKRLNVVASLPDALIGMSWFIGGQGELKTEAFMNALVQSGTITASTTGDWMILEPADRHEARQEFSPREPVTELMKSIRAKGNLDVRDYASYAFKSGRTGRIGFPEMYLSMLDRSMMTSLDHTDWNALRLYGSFATQQRASIDAGRSLTFNGLTPAQKSIVERILYAGLIESSSYIDENSRNVASVVDPTDTFANGLPDDGTIYAIPQLAPTLVAYGKGSDGKIRPLRTINAWTIATFEADTNKSPELLRAYGLTGLVGYAPGQNRLLRLRVAPTAKVWQELKITLPENDPSAKPVPWQELPEKLRSEIKAAIEQKKASMKEGGKVIPPQQP